MDTFRTGIAVVNADLSQAGNRWPRLTSSAALAGFCSIHAFPLRLRHQHVGVLTFFSTISLLQERAIHHSTLRSVQLQNALTSRIVIEQAKGAVARRPGLRDRRRRGVRPDPRLRPDP